MYVYNMCLCIRRDIDTMASLLNAAASFTARPESSCSGCGCDGNGMNAFCMFASMYSSTPFWKREWIVSIRHDVLKSLCAHKRASSRRHSSKALSFSLPPRALCRAQLTMLSIIVNSASSPSADLHRSRKRFAKLTITATALGHISRSTRTRLHLSERMIDSKHAKPCTQGL